MFIVDIIGLYLSDNIFYRNFVHISENTSESSTQNLDRMRSDFTFLWYILLGLLFSGHNVLVISHFHQLLAKKVKVLNVVVSWTDRLRVQY